MKTPNFVNTMQKFTDFWSRGHTGLNNYGTMNSQVFDVTRANAKSSDELCFLASSVGGIEKVGFALAPKSGIALIPDTPE